jgi:hypothetical protein
LKFYKRLRVDGGGEIGFDRSMGHIEVMRARERIKEWEVPVVMGANESNRVGFLVKIEKQYLTNLTGGVCSPERFARITIDYLLHKKQSMFAIDRQIHCVKLAVQFPDYEEEVRRKITGAFGL